MKGPVFVDHTGRRRRAAIIAGSGVGVFLILGLVMLVAGMLAGGPVPLPGWPDNAKRDPGGVAPSAGVAVLPAKTRTTPATTPTTLGTTPETTGPGNGNGNGNGHGRPTKPPGKP